MKKLIFLIFIIIIGSCSIQKSNITYTPISQERFLDSPFGFEESIKSFRTVTNPKFKEQKLLRKNKHYPEKTDTIYQFTFKKSEFFFYKSYSGNEFLLAGKVVNKQIQFKNGIHVGISKDVFVSRFSDKLQFHGDSLQMTGEGTKYTFLFSKNKLHRVNIDNYFD